jgi:inorganic pyrophosphatase
MPATPVAVVRKLVWFSSIYRTCLTISEVFRVYRGPLAGGDAKLLAVPVQGVLPSYKHRNKPEDPQPERLLQIQDFCQHSKDLEPGKWVKVVG